MGALTHINSIVALLIVRAFVSAAYEIQDTSDAMQYLSRFGYIGHDMASSMNIIDASAVLKEFQKMAGLNESGVLDPGTVRMMNMPRCGNKDMEAEMIPDPDDSEDPNSIRRKRYKLSETRAKWQKRELTYSITKFSQRMKVRPEEVEKDVAEAFRLWEQATNLNFIRSRGKNVDIEIGFASARHQDAFPFDGPGKTLAHAFSPGTGLGGDVHFDDHEEWTTNSYQGTNVLFVAVHEIGHSLGLSHSEAKGAIMQAFYGGYQPHLKLHPDDVAGIQSIYGKRETAPAYRAPQQTPTRSPTIRLRPNFEIPNTRFKLFPPSRETMANSVPVVTESATLRTTTTTTEPTTTRAQKPLDPSSPGFMRPDLCDDSKIDAITALNDGNIYVFKGYYVFQINPSGNKILPGWPKRIEYAFPGLEPNIDAGLTLKNGKTYFFKGGKYFRFEGFKMDPNYPKAISKHFPGIPDYVDAAFVYPLNKHIYFMKGEKYWRFDPTATKVPHVSGLYPIQVSLWKLPMTGVDSAFDSPQGPVYFFKDHHYWKFDSGRFAVAEAVPAYPRSTKAYWFGCKEANSDLRSVRGSDPDMDNYDYELEGAY